MTVEIFALARDHVTGGAFPVRAPQGASRPYAVISDTGLTERRTYQGTSGTEARGVQIDIYADTYAEVREVADALRHDLQRYQTDQIRMVQIDAVRDLPAADAGEVTQLFRRQIDTTLTIRRI